MHNVGGGRSKEREMREYSIDSKYNYQSRTVTKGTQEKYEKNGYYYKINKAGNEGYVEYIVYRVLSKSTLDDNMYVKYEYCKINGKSGCRSKSFLGENEVFVTMNTLYEKMTGRCDLPDKLMALANAKERLEYILDIADSAGIDREKYKTYMQIMMQIDWIIENTDRHVHNYGILYNRENDTVRLAPIFDNGMSLNTDRKSNKTACTLSGSFSDQVVAFGYPIVPAFKIDYAGLRRDLKRIEQTYGKHMELDVLKSRLAEVQGIFDGKAL